MSGSLWPINVEFDGNQIPNKLLSFKYKLSLIANRNGVNLAVPIKHFSNFWKLLEIQLITCKAELSLTWDPNCVLSYLVRASTFAITDAKLYVPIVTLSTDDLSKLLKNLKDHSVETNTK